MGHDVEINNVRFYVLRNNTTGSVSIPLTLSPTPTPLASITLRSNFDCGRAVVLNATVGWLAVTNGTGIDRVNVLFKIWRGSPATGNLIFSVVDSGESDFDNRKVTSFTHVDSNFDLRSSRPPSYFLTAELLDVGSAATVIGPITFIATEFEK
ncbi:MULTISPECIES: hypothetical protein [Sporomusa]|jgi:hypothetical protein|uniref:Uncharacterized protein n=1 Tax=Sporomusa sphaeroides DSM 2875 TaxID=1337886 RepID=A0ABM9W6D7_9FIRM|nr:MULTISPECIES: hypothetical protein [Sporomusa]OLS57577.1 hypothetical protein SPSPH_10930 [Sporomusa sphaeroides DSM 2875]CVK20727.1 hypothetical protein SSPH_03395 [Sporomusa sphaeroides DSM 2875]HML34578.1 hypothetical protein [Sporomusa sphaeroides]